MEIDSLNAQISSLQALANIGTSTCMIAHEINNLLTPLANYASFSLNNPDDKTLTGKALGKVIGNCDKIRRIMQSMLAVANGEDQEKLICSLTAFVDDIFGCLCRDFSKDGITVRIQIPEDLAVWAVPAQIQQLLMNLILNARDAMMPGGGVLTISASHQTDAVRIKVSDTGCGIDAADLDNIFEPFFTTKSDKSSSSHRPAGAGLGLAFCKKVIESHNGSISVESQPDEGTTFTIELPTPAPPTAENQASL